MSIDFFYIYKIICYSKVACEDLYNKMSVQNSDLWKEFQESGDLSLVGKLKLSAFETVVAVSAMRPGSLYRAVVNFVDQILGMLLLKSFYIKYETMERLISYILRVDNANIPTLESINIVSPKR